MTEQYRADQVGSFLRSQELQDAHTAAGRGELAPDKLRELEDREILKVLELQRQVGIDVLSDGEYRRGGWASGFPDAVDGYVEGTPAISMQWQRDGGVATAEAPAPSAAGNPAARIIGEKLRARRRLTATESGFLLANAGGPFKVTMPAPSYVVARGYKPGTTDKVYADRAAVLRDAADIIGAEVAALANEGVAYIQLDNPHYPDYIAKDRVEQWRSYGLDPDQMLREDIAADNQALAAGAGQQATLAMHLCRGNGGRAGWHTSGGYDPIAEQVFGGLNVDRYLLEYDSDRAGSFEPLRFIPKGKLVVLGLVTTKSGELESQDLLLKRIDEAARFVSLDNLALSPQCGFASTLQGNPLSWDEQRRKLELVVDTARKVWG
jgi:5-methyltetrahydropteroyltriglutamate--homocysteine methyltransferase